MLRKSVLRKAAVAFLLAAGLLVAAPAAANAATTYPPATTGTFAFTASPGSNDFTVTGLDPNEEASGIISGTGSLPTVGAFAAAATTLDLGQTSSSGTLHFTLVFPSDASGVYNLSISTPGGASASGYITIAGTALASTGSTIQWWIVWVAGIIVVLGIAAVVTSTVRRRRTR
ncbi:hypothetical protein [Gryllotalpicola ginsengisoli]|uniref:hypothetical protein n=1 Tax=Gryllotalpicola ginsengisoli TaxID=444608 RepID=UPI0003B35FDC|nr:hypothetical protein [Gryllotalpicola ginsengisoli]